MKTIKFQDGTEVTYNNLDQIQDELYERNIRIDKPAYIGDQVEIGNDVMIASDIPIVAGIKIEEGDSILTKPTYIYGSRHTVYNYKEDMIQIGHLTGTFKHWQENANLILRRYNYSTKQVREYRKYIKKIINSYKDFTVLEILLVIAIMIGVPLCMGIIIFIAIMFGIIKTLS